MEAELIELLRCLVCHSPLETTEAKYANNRIESGLLVCKGCSNSYPIVQSVPRFVSADNYCKNWGLQWNRFRLTQLDSYTGHPISRERFLGSTGWSREDLNMKSVLDVGCGAGRFAEIALSLGAIVTAVDYSSAVDACFQNLKHHPLFNVIQGDIYNLPFQCSTFDYIYCLGVIQHTPDVMGSLKALASLLKPGGELVVDVYLRNWLNFLHPKYWLRPLSVRLSPDKLFSIVERCVPSLLVTSLFIGKIPGGRYLRRFIPIANYDGVYPLNNNQLLEWAILDTYDWLSPRYDQPQTPTSLRAGLEAAGLEGVQVFRCAHLVGKGQKPVNASG